MYLAAMIIQIFLPCFFGNLVFYKSLELSGFLYSSDWIDQSMKYKKSVIIFGERLRRPIVITAGILNLKLETFIAVGFIS